MSVREMQCGSLVHFCMVNLGYKKSGHHSIFDLGGFETGPMEHEKKRVLVSYFFSSNERFSSVVSSVQFSTGTSP